MQVRFAALAMLLAAVYGCATEPEQTQAGAAAPTPVQPRSHTTLTGSRLPPMEDSSGSSMVGGQSGSDYIHDRNSSVSPMRGQ